MTTIDQNISSLGLSMAELPQELVARIDYLQEVRESLAGTKTEYAEETDPETREEMLQNINEGESFIAEYEGDILESLKEFHSEKNRAAIDATHPNGGNPAPNGEEKPKATGNGWKWALGVGLTILTLGAVNMMKNSE